MKESDLVLYPWLLGLDASKCCYCIFCVHVVSDRGCLGRRQRGVHYLSGWAAPRWHHCQTTLPLYISQEVFFSIVIVIRFLCDLAMYYAVLQYCWMGYCKGILFTNDLCPNVVYRIHGITDYLVFDVKWQWKIVLLNEIVVSNCSMIIQ